MRWSILWLCTAEAPEKDYKTLKVAQLRAELSRRDLPMKGYKAELVGRLEEDDREKAKAKAADEDSPMHDATKQNDTENGMEGDEVCTQYTHPHV